ncbi:MAG TPA: squalene/phytoene synthase family protein [Dysgonamonadaceae bacterium]|nr:squalene/phytoene synthase family protein [Dysgonamonadaceae bacterium]HOV35294.1 squalene/phytoene synthase family protein [Dysgonamonadaceae bacterium]
MGIDFFKRTSYQISELITRKYSTSFSLSISLLDNAERDAIYAIYGFVRLADEITVPGAGLPMTIISSKLAVERILKAANE